VHRHPDRPRRVGEPARDRLADPPARVGRELETPAPVELLDRANQPKRPFLDQVEEGEALVAVLLGDRDDQAQVRLDHRPLRVRVAPFDPLRQLDLLSRCQQRVSTGVTQEELEGVGRRLRNERERRRALVVDQLDSLLLELAAESVKLERFELALVKDLRERALPERARLLGGLKQLLPLLTRQGMRFSRCFEADRVVRHGELLSLDRKSVATSRGAGGFQMVWLRRPLRLLAVA
jgi:hypothetical protein